METVVLEGIKYWLQVPVTEGGGGAKALRNCLLVQRVIIQLEAF